jgi:hypothetical protein
MVNQMVRFPSSMALLEPGQSFMVGSIIIGANGVEETMEAAQASPAQIVPTTAPTPLTPAIRRWTRRSINNDDLIESIDRVTNGLTETLSLMESILDQSATGNEFPALQDHQVAASERPARAHQQRRPDSDLVITATLGGRTARRRPLPVTGLRLADYEARTENLPKPHPFGLESVGSAYQNAIHHLFIDHVERSHVSDLYAIDPANPDQPAPMINMVAIRQLTDDTSDPTESLHNILNESPDESSEVGHEFSTHTVLSLSSCPTCC